MNQQKQQRIQERLKQNELNKLNKFKLNSNLEKLNSNLEEIEYLIILDFEANCDEEKTVPIEIIEFPCVVYSVKENKIKRELDFHHFCKINTPVTDFCTKLTTITQTQTDQGKSLQEVLKLNKIWLKDNKLEKSIFVTCGDWDLKTALPFNTKFLNIEYPDYLKKWCNLKVIFEEKYNKKGVGMSGMLFHLNLDLDGIQHRGIDDAANIAKICKNLIENGARFRYTNLILN